MTHEELVGQLMLEGFPRREAEHEAELIEGAIIDESWRVNLQTDITLSAYA